MPTPKSSRWIFTSLTLLGLGIAITGPRAMPIFAQDGGSRRSDGDGEGRRSRGWGRGERSRDGSGEDRPRSFGRGDDGDRRREESTSSSKPTSPAATKSASSPSSSAASMDMNEYAKGLIKQYDKNDDSMLQADEQRELRGKAASADLNKDGTITREELVAHLSAASTPSQTPAVSSGESSKSESSGEEKNRGEDSGRRRGRRGDSSERSADGENSKNRVYTASITGDSSSKSEKASRRSFRFTPPAERLPSGLPDWFTSKDKDGDGQVSMREYNRSWSDRTAAEFRRYDLDNDGMITAKEAAKSKKGE